MTTNQEGVHLAVRDITGTARSYNEDWHALFDSESIAAGSFNARMLAWINATLSTSYTNVNEAMQAFAVDQGFANWASMNTFETVTLIDPRTSLVSRNFGTWLTARSTRTLNNAVAPDGNTTATRITEDTTAAAPHSFYTIPTLTAAQHTFSVFAKAGTRTQIHMLFQLGAAYPLSIFDLTGGGSIISSGAGHSTKITAVGSGWFRCSVTATASAMAQEVDVGLANANAAAYTGDGVSYAHIWEPFVGLGGPL